ncbi:alternative ribosome rescue aminoacyl-tRNA hydrolase ArfB [Alphaproteobacteria bacterium]|nr:alternative ribosome rescue aminoacyl-tRNA hydrolase ArfB [Alphaproteobacteria bacterium]
MPGIQITDTWSLPLEAVDIRFIRSSGPGGQNVNKVASAVQLRFNVSTVRFIGSDMRDRLRRAAGRRMTGEGVIVITARRFKSQERNRQDAIDRLTTLLQSVVERPVFRRPTRPGRSSREKRLQSKQHRSRAKMRRSAVHAED